ncbi:Response regulator receiver modulated diguanylate cyclase [Desulfamplus magnetovallimortis]|uniref:diguanylate cyclase n=1 Tax=Desulfamplus magnetovallimortis TaxID=1246637 RepID=A0A1W1H522_9BACT|nr:diguanylate cyclase [Desulfamplus magnetovallimortis]SLM27583.1 Response regulator receiver modulated diguanylate cyclase [Desulfamplus magnetovallimortis]
MQQLPLHSSSEVMDRILVVDDTPTNIKVLAGALVSRYQVQVATSGKAALKILSQEQKPHLVLLDIMMPEMDGYEVCKRMKSDSATRDIPVIFVSAKTQVSDQQYGFDLGAVDYITKPFEIPLVLARINVHLRLKHKSDQLEKLALVDALTDIPNRRALDDCLDREIRRSVRNESPMSILMLDIDHFKNYNDHYGHGAGDVCLRSVAKSIENCLRRPGDLVGRYGGEEFVVILPDCDETCAAAVAEKIRDHISRLNIAHAKSLVSDHITVSVGIKTTFCQSQNSCDQVLNQVDNALYNAKKSGRNCVMAAT